MVFPSINPLYLDPHNWQQQQQSHQHGTGGSNGNHDQYPVMPPPPSMGGGGGSTGSIRPGSMVDRARLANLPQPEPGLKCPRCESNNTKFCYFNNYNLAQPRHFCKTCRRYWTRGGALRSVPVGGGCRRNKRSTKSNNNNGTTSKSTSITSSSTITDVMPTHFPQMPIMPSSQNLGNTNMSTTTEFGASRNNLGLNFGGAQQECELGLIQLGSNNNINRSPTILSNSQLRNPQHAQHFPFLTTSFEPSAAANTSFYQLFQNEDHQNVVENAPSSNQLSESMKMEDQSPLGLNLTKSLLGGGSENISQYWGNGGNAWNDFSGSGLNSSSSNNLL